MISAKSINQPPLLFLKDLLIGDSIVESRRVLADLGGVFLDQKACSALSPDTLVYEVSSHLPAAEGTPGGLYFGITRIFPGRVGDEYFMTKGHFHARRDRVEYYWGIEGEGVLILMDEHRRVWGERMFPGSLHHIPGGTAHRVANTGSVKLSFAACWPSDAGHDYESIAADGFSARLRCLDNKPVLL